MLGTKIFETPVDGVQRGFLPLRLLGHQGGAKTQAVDLVTDHPGAFRQGALPRLDRLNGLFGFRDVTVHVLLGRRRQCGRPAQAG